MELKFQFVNANPAAEVPVGIDAEKRDIQEILKKVAVFSDAPALRLADLEAAVRENKPRVVHFCGHGTSFGELMLLDEDDKPYGADKNAIAAIFELNQARPRLVVLNCCFSQAQAELIQEHVESVVGIDRTIGEENARDYARNLYKFLRDGMEIKAAHERLTKIFLKDKQVEPDHWPRLWTRANGARGVIFPVSSPELERFRKEREERFGDDLHTFGVHLKAAKLSKRSDSFGNSLLEYSIEGLKVEGGDGVKFLRFRLETPAGIVHSPVLDEASEKLVSWHPTPRKEPANLEEVVNSARRIEGEFKFRQKLTRKNGPYTFGWKVMIFNMDATTTWEFENLYTRQEDRLHVDGTELKPPQEYIARLVWLPTEHLSLHVQLPPGSQDPIVRSFDWNSQQAIEKSQLIQDVHLLSGPPEAFESQSASSFWESRPGHDALELDSLSGASAGRFEFELQHPAMGSWYSLDWKLKEFAPSGLGYRLIQDAEEVRRCLVKHREARLKQQTTKWSNHVTELLRKLHLQLRRRFPQDIDDAIFETAFLSYDMSSRRVVVCEAFHGDGQEAAAGTLSVSWPFGMGLAGACFRAGTGIFTYAKAKITNSKEPDTYLPYPGQPEHEYLLAVPIDHPEFTIKKQGALHMERSRQLIGVLTISSTYGPSGLQEFCLDPPEGESEYAKWHASVQGFKDECQIECDAFSRSLLDRGKRRP